MENTPGKPEAPDSDSIAGLEAPIRKWQIFMALLSIGNLAIVGWVEAANIDWPDPAFERWAIIDAAMITLLLADFFVRLAQARRHKQLPLFLSRNWYDLIGLIPLYVQAIPALHAAAALRFLRVIRLLRLLRALPAMRRFYESVGVLQRIVKESQVARLLSVVAILLLLAAAGFWVAEPRSEIKDFDDALWCSVTTFTTAGYVEPQTGAGRLLATVMMLLGMATGTAVATALVTTTLRLRDEERSPEHLEMLEALRADKLLSEEQYAIARRRLLISALEGLRHDGILNDEQLQSATRRCG